LKVSRVILKWRMINDNSRFDSTWNCNLRYLD
jgi:hypothetical protein